MAEARLSEEAMLRGTIEMEKKQFMEAYQQLRVSSENEKRQLHKTIEEMRTIGETLNREVESLRIENQVIKSRLSDRTAKLEECLQILNKRYSHFEKKLENVAEPLHQDKLEAEVLKLKEELLLQYQVNHDLKNRLNEAASMISSRSKPNPISSSEIFGSSSHHLDPQL